MFKGEHILNEPPRFTEPGVIIVDNEESGFQIHTQPHEPRLIHLFTDDTDKSEYVRFNMNRPPYSWEKTINEKFYGTRKTAVYKRAGDGDLALRWTAVINQTGNYDLFCYTPEIIRDNRRNRNQLTYLSFRVHSDDGVYEITIDPKTSVNDWTYIGNFFYLRVMWPSK